MSLFVIALLVFAVGVVVVLLARLLRSYPLGFAGLVAVIAAGVFAFVDDKVMLGVVWLLFSIIAAVAGALNLYKNSRGAFWWSLGAVIALVLGAVPWGDLLEDPDTGDILTIVIPAAAFLVIGLLGSLLLVRLMHKDKQQRKHHSNIDLIIGSLVTVAKDKEGLNPQRGFINDVDWAIEPLYPYDDEFKVGDVVKVCKIKGVTLLCVRDGKDYRKEMKEKREAEKAEEARKRAEEEEAKKAAEAAKEEEVVKEEPAPVEEAPVEEPAPVEEVQPEPEPEPQPEPEPEPQPEPEPEPQPEPEPEPQPEPEPEPEPQPEPAPVKEKAEFVPFQARLAQADDFLRNAYNELKSEVLSYGIKSRVSSTGDTFRLHKKEYVKMVVAGKYLKLFLALNPEDYKDTTYPFEDASKLGTRQKTPFVFKIKSGLSVRRAKVLIGDAAKKDGLEQGEVVPKDHFAELQASASGDEGEEEAE